jgi:hypothetical protein
MKLMTINNKQEERRNFIPWQRTRRFDTVDTIFFNFLGWGVTESTWYVGHYLVRFMDDDDECGTVGGM